MQIQIAQGGPTFSRTVAGVMNLSQWQMSTPELISWIEACLDMGVTTFDHADIYGSYTCESLFGSALAQNPGLRKRMQIVTKCGIALLSPNRPDHWVHHYDTTHDHIMKSVDRSLRNLHTDYLDLLLIHRPDPLMDADSVAAAFNELKASGKVRYFGVSNFLPQHFELLQSRLDFPLVTNQIEFSVLQMQALEDGTLNLCQRRRIAPMVWSPVGGGHLFDGKGEQAVRVRNTLTQIAGDLGGVGLDQVALAWILAHPTQPLPVLGTGKLERIKAALEAESLQLSRQQWFAIWEASAGHEVP